MSGLEIPEFDYETGESGDLVVTATVRNAGDERVRTTVTANVTAGDREEHRSAEVTLDPGESSEERFEFDIPTETFQEGGSLDFSLGDTSGEIS